MGSLIIPCNYRGGVFFWCHGACEHKFGWNMIWEQSGTVLFEWEKTLHDHVALLQINYEQKIKLIICDYIFRASPWFIATSNSPLASTSVASWLGALAEARDKRKKHKRFELWMFRAPWKSHWTNSYDSCLKFTVERCFVLPYTSPQAAWSSFS